MKQIKSRNEIREAVLTTSQIDFDGETYEKTKSKAGFLLDNGQDKKFLFNDTMYKVLVTMRKHHEISKNGNYMQCTK